MSSSGKGSDLGGMLDGIHAEVRGAIRDAQAAVTDATSQVAGIRPLIDEVVRTITDVDTIKALADPTRLAILRALSRDRVPKSAKELAEELGEPQTKLYRHLKVLLEAGLIEAAETRVVSGIVETKYRAAQSSVTIDGSEHPDETVEPLARMISGNMSDYRDRFLWNFEHTDWSADPEKLKKDGAVMNLSAVVSPELADEFQRRLEELVKEFDSLPRDPNGVRIEGLISWFRPKPAPRSERSDRSDPES
ncbi:MAG: helix-turn-helix domain-containing protein [Catenulisporales bacterium]|nr:helix-turn-helix domain-containing protein [Catenulisporales bacterium]